jgi:hypothetical protein
MALGDECENVQWYGKWISELNEGIETSAGQSKARCCALIGDIEDHDHDVPWYVGEVCAVVRIMLRCFRRARY